ncbi:hypothetical protein K523DRAFT_401787, partial [Schizophyllum commune Tattone D]
AFLNCSHDRPGRPARPNPASRGSPSCLSSCLSPALLPCTIPISRPPALRRWALADSPPPRQSRYKPTRAAAGLCPDALTLTAIHSPATWYPSIDTHAYKCVAGRRETHCSLHRDGRRAPHQASSALITDARQTSLDSSRNATRQSKRPNPRSLRQHVHRCYRCSRTHRSSTRSSELLVCG